MSRTARWAAVLLVAGCSGKASRPQRPPVPVTMTPVRRTSVPYTFTASGIVMPRQTTTVTPQVDGIVTSISFREGDDVRSGQALFQIEPQQYQAAHQQALAVLARDSATAANARTEAGRYEALAREQNVTREQADQFQSAAAAADATVQSDRAALGAAKFNLEKTTVRAPIGGRTGSLLTHVGNVVRAAGATPLVVIDQIRPILVRFAVPGSQLPLIQQYSAGGKLAVTATPTPSAGGPTPGSTGAGGSPPPQTADAASGPSRFAAQGTLAFIDNAVDTTTGTIMLKAEFPNADGRLWPGEFTSVTLLLFTEDSALVVPSQAVMTSQQETYVYVVDSSGKAQQRSVRVERTAGPVAVIASGLNDGEQVVVEGQSRISPGASVTVVTGSDSAGSGTGGRGRKRGGGGGRGGKAGGGAGADTSGSTKGGGKGRSRQAGG
jgi:multidrug efflux system membrane fusion protein